MSVMTFHWDSHNKGKNIKLSGGGRTAKRVRDRNYGVVITEECLRLGQKIRFKLDQLDRDYWASGGLVKVLLILLN